MSVTQEHIPAATMNPVLIAKGRTPVTASLDFNGIQIRCDVKVTLEVYGLAERYFHLELSKLQCLKYPYIILSF